MIIRENVKKFTRSFGSLFIIFLAFQFTACSNVGEKADALLAQVTDYEYGQNRTKLMEFSDLVVEASKSESESKIVEESLLKFLKSDPSFPSKQFACQQLSIIGSEKSVSVLIEMVKDEKTTNTARYALERIPSKKVDEQLLQALESGSKKIKIGIINTLGVRKCKKAAAPIAKLIKSDDLDIAVSAASALGSIKGDESIKLLAAEINTSNKELQNIVANSYLLCVDNIALKHPLKASTIYNNVYNSELSVSTRQSALVGMINTSDNKEELIYSILVNGKGEMKYVAIPKLKDLPPTIDISKFTMLLADLAPENQIQLLGVIEDRSDVSSKNYVLKTLKSKHSLVRIASLNALANIGDESDVLTIAMIAASRSGDERNAARSCLALLKDAGVDRIIVSNISHADKNLKIELIRAAGERGSVSALNALLENLDSKDRQVRTASYAAISDIAPKEQLPSLTEKLFNIPFESDRKKMERTISKILLKYPDEAFTKILIRNVQTDKSINNKASSLRLLGYTNSTPALDILRKNRKSENQQIMIASINGLSSWANTEPLYDLLEATENAENEKIKQPALKGFINFITIDESLSDSLKIELYKKALQYAKTSNEKNMALDGVGHIDNFESLDIFKKYYKDPSVKQTVEDGVNRVSWHLADQDPERVRTYIHEFLKMTTDEKYIAKCNRVLEKTDKIMKNRNM